MSNDIHSSKKEDNSEYKHPDLIIIDDRDEEPHTVFQQSEERSRQSSQNEAKNQPISLRLLCFCGVIFCLIVGVGTFLCAILTSIIALFTFFKNREINQSAYQFWKQCINIVVSCFGFLLGIFVPPLGLGFLLLYYSMTGEPMDSSILSKIIKHGFGRN